MTLLERVLHSRDITQFVLSGNSSVDVRGRYFPESSHSQVRAVCAQVRSLDKSGKLQQAVRDLRVDSSPVTPNSLVESHSVSGDTWTATGTTSERIHTLDQLLDFFQVNRDLWSVSAWTANKWEQASKDPNTGDVTVTELYQVKATFKLRQQMVSISRELEALRLKAASYAPIYPHVEYSLPRANKMLELCLADHHFGKLAWGREAGHGDYDLKIAAELYDAAVNGLLASVPAFDYEQVVCVVGNDLLNSDTVTGTTTSGTAQDNDGRYHKAFELARDAVIRQIELCVTIAPVKIIGLPGNHDTLSTWHLIDSVKAWFRNCPNVTFDNEPRTRKYHRFHKVLLGFAHGNKGKRDNLPLTMAQECRRQWGETTWSEIHIGHWHKEAVDELLGVKVRVLPALSGTDAWHSEMGYVANIRASEAFVWDGDRGLVATALYNAPRTDSGGVYGSEATA